MGINLRMISRCCKVHNIWIPWSIRSFNTIDKPLISNNQSVLSRRVFVNIKFTRPCVVSVNIQIVCQNLFGLLFCDFGNGIEIFDVNE